MEFQIRKTTTLARVCMNQLTESPCVILENKIIDFNDTYYMELFNETYRDPDIANCIFGLLNDLNENFLILNNDTNRKLQHIYDLFTKQNLSKNEVIFKIISETPELFIKINDAITLDYMSKCGLIKIDDFDIEDDKYPNFIELFGFETNVESMNTYKMFMEKSISFIRAINRSIVDDGINQNNEEKIYYKIMNSEQFDDIQPGNDIQIMHFVTFSSDDSVYDNFHENPCVGDILVELIVPIDCCNACCYREPLNKKDDLWSKINSLFETKKNPREILLTPPFTIFKVMIKEDDYIQLKVVEDNQQYYEDNTPRGLTIIESFNKKKD